ncbi:thermonuclease family protein [Paraliobacillus sediminis]|uniref:thermonuclease family protein n=1 Tax=Paraliobacillus sediminis TaxID=1885916 RepID=UPI000E3BBDF6|nr:thermonuclease family protein [Paraliobacillus sediminis]
MKPLLQKQLGLFLILFTLLTGCGLQETQTNSDFPSATVDRVVDGDTVHIILDGEEESVRLLLVDTPETKHPNLPIQPYGEQASQFANETLAEGKQIQIEYDGPKRDKYGRLLAYIWVDGELFNEMLLEEGFARYAYEYDPPYTHSDRLNDAETEAKEADRNIWSEDGYVTEDGFTTIDINETTSETSETEETSVDIYYQNCTAVHDANASPVSKGDPGYGKHLDRDGDGIACE